MARSHDRKLEDRVEFRYETRTWTDPATLSLATYQEFWNSSTFEAEVLDAEGVRCLDSRHVIRFSLAGEDHLIAHSRNIPRIACDSALQRSSRDQS